MRRSATSFLRNLTIACFFRRSRSSRVRVHLIACLLHQTATKSAVGVVEIKQIQVTGQIENAGIWKNSGKAEHRSRTGAGTLASPGNSSLDSQKEMRSGAKGFGSRDERNAAKHSPSFSPGQTEKLNRSPAKEAQNNRFRARLSRKKKEKKTGGEFREQPGLKIPATRQTELAERIPVPFVVELGVEQTVEHLARLPRWSAVPSPALLSAPFSSALLLQLRPRL